MITSLINIDKTNLNEGQSYLSFVCISYLNRKVNPLEYIILKQKIFDGFFVWVVGWHPFPY